MADLNQQAKKEQVKVQEKEISKAKGIKGVRQDIEDEDDEESYYKFVKENPLAGQLGDDSDGEQIEYDEDGNPIKLGKKHIDPLPSVDHSTITYSPFEKNFYEEHEEIRNLTHEKVEELRLTLGLKVTGINIYTCKLFVYFNLSNLNTNSQVLRFQNRFAALPILILMKN